MGSEMCIRDRSNIEQQACLCFRKSRHGRLSARGFESPMRRSIHQPLADTEARCFHGKGATLHVDVATVQAQVPGVADAVPVVVTSRWRRAVPRFFLHLSRLVSFYSVLRDCIFIDILFIFYSRDLAVTSLFAGDFYHIPAQPPANPDGYTDYTVTSKLT